MKNGFLFFLSLLFFSLPVYSETFSLSSLQGEYKLFLSPPNSFQVFINLPPSKKIADFQSKLEQIQMIQWGRDQIIGISGGNQFEIFFASNLYQKSIFFELGEQIESVQTYPFHPSFFLGTANQIIEIDPNTLQKNIRYQTPPSSSKIQAFALLPDSQFIIAHQDSNQILLLNSIHKQAKNFSEIKHLFPILDVKVDSKGLIYIFDQQGNLTLQNLPFSSNPIHYFPQVFQGYQPSAWIARFDFFQQKLFIQTNQYKQSSFNLEDLTNGIWKGENANLMELSKYQLIKKEGIAPLEKPTLNLADKPAEPDYLELAKQEIKNKNFYEARELLNKIGEFDPNYQESRKLQNHIHRLQQSDSYLDQAEIKAQTGQKSQARFLLKRALKENPNNQPAKKLLLELEEEEFQIVSEKSFIIVLFFIFAFLIFFYRKTLFAKFFPSQKIKEKPKPDIHVEKPTPAKEKIRNVKIETKKEPIFQPSAPSEKERLRFKKLLKITLTILENTISIDQEKQYAKSWKTIYQEIQDIEKRGYQKGADYKELVIILNQIQKTITDIQKNLYQQNNAKLNSSQNSSQQENYYQLLGVSFDASLEQIKNAYRGKIKAYHPDKHQNTDFEWIKKEAKEKTLKIQEAYRILSDVMARKEYDKTLKSKLK